MSRLHKRILAASAVLAGLAAVCVAAAALFDWNQARGLIAAEIKHRTGRDLAIEGNLGVDLFSLEPRVRAERVTLGNADWGEGRPMLTADAVEFSVSLRDLVRGKIVFPDVSLKAPAVLLERDALGRRNWILDPSRQQTGASPQIVRLQVDSGQIEFKDAMSNTALRARLGTLADGKYGIRFSAEGRISGIPVAASGAGGALLTLLDAGTPYPLRLKSTIGGTSIEAEGTLYGVATLSGVDARFSIVGRNLASLSDPLQIALPPTAPYRLTGRLVRSGSTWRFEGFRGSVGRSDLGGDLSVDTAPKRTMLRGKLRSALLDIADLGGFIGADPGASAAARGRVLPQAEFNLDKLRRIDADISLQAGRFTNRDRLPLDGLKAHLLLADGVLRLEPVDFGVAGGHVRSLVWFDARSQQIEARAETGFQRLHINQLVPRAEILESALGTIDGHAKLQGRGNSTAQMLGTAQGRVALVSSGGSVSNLLLALAGADGARILRFLVLGDRNAPLHCAAVSFNVKQGVMASEVMVVDASDTNISGEGRISLRDETLDFTLQPLPKNPSLLSLRGPLHVSGTFAEPGIAIDKPTVTLRAGGALLLGVINPFAALLPLVETGPGKDTDCARLAGIVAAARHGVPASGARAPRS